MADKTNFGNFLVKEKIIDKDQLKEALKEQKATGNKLFKILTRKHLVEEKVLGEQLAKQLKISFIDLAHYDIKSELTKKLPENYARHFQAILLKEDKNGFLVGMVDPSEIFAVDELANILRKPLRFAVVGETELKNVLDLIYRRTEEIHGLAEKLAGELKMVELPEAEEEITQADPAVSKLISSFFEDAIQVRASDIHIEPAENFLRIRFRVDGILQEQDLSIEGKSFSGAIGQRLKLMAGLNIAERRLPQDGGFKIKVRDDEIDVRLSTMPTYYGESIVLRLLTAKKEFLGLDSIGMPARELKRFRELIKLPKGIILVTGPTGSGKTTTLYGALTEVNEVGKNIITIEDPIEYHLERINQVQVNPQLGLDFALVLRAAMRQDPNIMLVGEIRDKETAAIALRAALTGHLVFVTLHTNDAAGTVVRLLDIGVENYLVASTVSMALSQRLMRKICDSCKEEHNLTESEKAFLTHFFDKGFLNRHRFHQGKGCTSCNFTGYKGRTGVFELLEFDYPMRDAIQRNDMREFTKAVANNRRTPTLIENAFQLAKDGVTTFEEVMRVAAGS
jgi:MSHA biogenesis protein MshE